MLNSVLTSLRRNPRRVLAAVAGVALAVALFADTAFFIDGSGAQMTSRAVAHVTIDMQASVNDPLASSLALGATVDPRPPLRAGQPVKISLVARNDAPVPAHAVVVDAAIPPQLGYQPESTQRDGVAVPDVAPPSAEPAEPDAAAPPPTPVAPSSPLESGLLLGDLAPGGSTTVVYGAATRAPVSSAADLLTSSIRSSEEPAPAPANGPTAVELAALAGTVRSVENVRAAQPFALVDLPAGTVEAGSQVLDTPVKLVGLDPEFAGDIPIVAFPEGRFLPGTAFVSPAIAQRIGAAPGSTLQLRIPGLPGGTPLALPVGAVADLTGAGQLFATRDEERDFVSAPNVVGVDIATFERQVLPALRVDAAAEIPTIDTPPVLEVEAQVARDTLSSTPGSALRAAVGVRRAIERTAPGEVTVTDNLSASLTRARTDSSLAKVLFIALGLPGALLAGYLAFYGASLLAEAERRERALLRARGFTPAALTRAAAYQAIGIAVLGGVLGVAMALGVAALLFPDEFNTSGGGFAVSILLSLAVALVTTVVAVYLPARRALLREVTEDRQPVPPDARPAWLRARLDLVLLLVAALVSGVFVITGGMKPKPGATEESIARSFYILLAPWCLWLGGTLLASRVFLATSRRMAASPGTPDFRTRLVTRTLLRSVTRRPRAVSAGIVTLSLAVAFGMSLAIFVATFRDQQRSDSRFLVGSDIRVTPSVGDALPSDFEQRLRVPGVRGVTPVAEVPNAVLGADTLTFAGIEPDSFAEVAPLGRGVVTDISPEEAIGELTDDPQAVLIDQETADDFNVEQGDTIKVQIPSPALGQPTLVTFRVVGTVIQFPGFPTGLDFVGNLNGYQQATGASTPSYFLLRTDGTQGANTRVTQELRAALGPQLPARIDTTARVGSPDQTSVAGLSLTGLGRVQGLYMLLIASLGIIVFVAAMLMQRSTERAVMRALGMSRRRLRAVVLGEAVVVSTVSVVVGTLIGIPMAYMFVQILRRIFVVPPSGLAFPGSAALLLISVAVITIALAAVIISVAIRRLRLVELLRTE